MRMWGCYSSVYTTTNDQALTPSLYGTVPLIGWCYVLLRTCLLGFVRGVLIGQFG